MKDKKPELRLLEYCGDWETKMLNEVFDILDGDRGKNYPGELDFCKEGHTLFLDTGNVKKNGFLFSNNKFISKKKDEQLKNGKLKLNDFVLTSRGTLGNVAFYDEVTQSKYSSIRINSAMLILRPKLNNTVSNNYLEAILRGNIIENFINKNKVGSAQPHITKGEFSKVNINIPVSIDEQNKIGIFFKKLDKILYIHQQELDALKQTKQGFLQKMFPKDGEIVPEVRFKNFMESWREVSLGTISDSYSGGTPSAGNKQYYNGTIPFIRSAEINSSTTELFLTEEGLNNSSAKLVQKGTILYAMYGATSGEVGISRIDGAINQAILAIKPKEEYDIQFLYQYLKKSKKSIVNSYLQGGQGNLSGAIIKKVSIWLPENREEQIKIGEFFRQLDEVIELKEQELEALKQTKKGFLQKMFV